MTVTNIKEVKLSRTMHIPMGGIHPPTLYTSIPEFLTKIMENKEIENKEKVAKLDKESGNHLTLFPKSETKKAPPKGIATNKGIRLWDMVIPLAS